MVVCQEIKQIRKFLSELSPGNQLIGFVPTMGALHKGHIKLLEQARKESDILISSIFVNPIQFNSSKDFENYPKDLDDDIKIMDKTGCDVVFVPSVSEMYPLKPAVSFHFGPLENRLEGSYRPGHFNGVGLVLSKLFNIIRPSTAYFGQKDLQQASIVTKMVHDLSFDIDIKVVATIRELDGLACSSRNRRLTEGQRMLAPSFYKALKNAQSQLLSNVAISKVQNELSVYINSQEGLSLEYFEVVNSKTMEPVDTINGNDPISLCIAGYVGDVRLLDNIYLFEGESEE